MGSKGWDKWGRKGGGKKKGKVGSNPYKQHNPCSIFTTLYGGRLEGSSRKPYGRPNYCNQVLSIISMNSRETIPTDTYSAAISSGVYIQRITEVIV